MAEAYTHLLKSPRAQSIFRLTVIPCVIVLLYHFFTHDGRMHPTGRWTMGRDFINYWSGAKLALAGQTDLLSDVRQYIPYLHREFGEDLDGHNWSYPPHTLLFIWPLAFLPYLWAFALWVTAGVSAFYYALKKLTQNVVDARVLLLAPATFLAIYTGQNGFFTAAIILLSFSILKTRPILAGVLIGCLTFKPQLGILIPVVLLLSRQWKTFIAAGVTTVGLIGLSIAIFGLDIWTQYFTEIMPFQTDTLSRQNTIFSRMVPSMFATMNNLDVPLNVVWGMQYLISAFVFLTTVWAFYKKRPYGLQIAILCTSTLMFSPYVANYDMAILAPAVYLFYRYLVAKGDNLSIVQSGYLIVVALSPILGQFSQSYGVPTYFVILVSFHVAVLVELRTAPGIPYKDKSPEMDRFETPVPS